MLISIAEKCPTKLKYLRSVANGDIYECSCCHAEILVQPKTVTPYCSQCGAEFDDDDNLYLGREFRESN